jgi:exopolysaccharide biosynthesis predicted pyruvyltransferase EpsI
MKLDHNQLIASLAQKIGEVLKPLVADGGRCALLDFPNHGNVGDNAIWLGEKAFLRSVNAAVVYTSDIAAYSKAKLAKRLRGGILFIHGGGNLGDVWLPHQRFREQVIAEFPDAQIIQLPQTIHFKEKSNLQRARSIFNNHPNLTLLVRDVRSLEIARNEFRAPSYLCPDMAFMLRGLSRPELPKSKIVWLSRTDMESSGYFDFHPEPDVHQADWRRDPRSLVFRANNFLTRHSQSQTPVLSGFASSLSCAYDALARYRLLLGCRMLSQGRVVVTDRLHGHILSLLLGIPNVLLDNNYGKVKSFYETWTKGCGLTVWADSLEEAFDAGRSLAQPSDDDRDFVNAQETVDRLAEETNRC